MSGGRTQADLDRVDEVFRSGAGACPAPPTRFYLNLSEVCQLRCTHCITSAPELTHTGRARSMSAEVLDVLTPHLRHATYVGLTHAGEPLLAPQLVPTLERLRDQRAGEPTVVHLLTNGMALTPARFEQLVELGVCSWSFSLDGMSAQTNDVLREGARVDVLIPRLRELSALRRRSYPKVRMGLAWTVSRDNAAEVPAAVQFARSAGLDWMKLEEMFPINGPAKTQLLPGDELRQVVERATALADRIGLPLLDHTESPKVWKCQLVGGDPRMVRFSRLDDLVNRMEINPCRMPYEAVFIEPNGDLKPLDFHSRPVGNVLSADLLALWSSEPFQALRRQVAAHRLCGGGPATCGRDPGPARWAEML